MPRAQRGQDALVRLDIDLADAVFGARKELDIDTYVACTTCTGKGAKPGSTITTCEACKGRGHVQRVARSFLGQVMTTAPCTACGGYGTIIPQPCDDCRGEGRVRQRRTLAVNVPAGVDTGTRIRLAARGEVGPGGGPAADLYVEIRERAHEHFVRRGDDLHCTLPVPMTTAALGTVMTLDTLDGPQQVDIRPGTQPGQHVTLKGLGVGRLNSTGRGDLHVHIEVQVPTALDDAQADLLKQLATLRGEEAPQPRLNAANPGMFSRLREKLAGR
jgi:molecular chaperone DnaJ